MAFEVGQAAEVTRGFSAADVADYVALGGHEPPSGTLPEPLIGALFSYLLGVQLPGVGTNYLKHESNYHSVVDIDQLLTARVEITRVRVDKHLVDLATTCSNAGGDVICSGRALVYVGDVVRHRHKQLRQHDD